MARVLVGQVRGLSFYADDGEGLDTGTADTLYGEVIDHEKARLEACGCTVDKAQLINGAIVVYPDDALDDPRIKAGVGV